MGYSIESTAELVRASVAIIAIVASIQFMLLPTLTERFRQRLFETRRDLFVLIAEGRLAPNHPAYVLLRNSINGLLRRADQLSFSKLLVLGVVGRKAGTEHRRKIEGLIENVPDEIAKDALKMVDRAIASAIIRYAIIRSPLAWIMVFLLLLVVAVALVQRAQLGAWKVARKVFRLELHKRVPTDGLQAEIACVDSDLATT